MKKISRRQFIPIIGTSLIGASCVSLGSPSILNTSDDFKRILPARLNKGDTIGVSAPAGGIKSPKELDEFRKTLTDLGFKVKFSENCTNRYGYFSGTDKERASDFMQLIEDNNVKAIFFLRGGWGCARILPFLNFEIIKKNPKIIMGFSDITTLLNAISVQTGLVTFHGPGGNSSWNEYSIRYIKQLLEQAKTVEYQNSPEDSPIVTYHPGVGTGELYGGNLSVICSLIGTEYLPDWTGKILFLEDVGEEPYRIDRMLTQLKQVGVFNKINGLILGNFRKCIAEEPDRSFTLEEVFEQHFSTADFPVFYGAQIGHTKHKFTIPVGLKIEMNAQNGYIKLLYPAVH